ncbi:hypothetical protein [Streptosporangium subroseum]|uniref:hypothetical protein n=1 Tax=Streptosporangium subroseum TaxID=106412 RepID=UPI001C53185A|nr:hypothetical protein [Streptosporangium subroseum]
MVLKTLEKAGGVEVLAAAHEAVSAHHGNNYLPLLEQYYGSHCAALFTLVNAITLESTSADRSVVETVEFLRALRGAKAVFVPERLTVERVGAFFRDKLAALARSVDAGYPSNTDLVLEGGRPVLKRRKGVERRPEALGLEVALHDRLPQRALLDVLTRTAYLLGWHHHFGPAPGSDPKIKEALARATC